MMPIYLTEASPNRSLRADADGRTREGVLTLKPEGRLLVAAGVASETGKRADNQDFAGVYTATETERANHGLIAGLADGVGGAKAGRMAAELAVRALIDGLYDQPDTIGVAAAAARVMGPYNRWLASMGSTPDMAHAATTFTAFVLKGRRGHSLHVGDSRAWHFRGGRLTCLTEDHTRSHPDQRHILYRAIGIEERLRLDHQTVELEVHDRLLLTSDGVHGILDARKLEKLLGARSSAEADAAAIVAAALAAGSQDNASAVVLDIVALPAPDHDVIAGDIDRLPILPPPGEGESIDGFRLDALLSDGRYTRLFRATDTVNGQSVAIKFPKPALLSEGGARLAFSREMLVGSRVNSPFVGGVIAVSPDRQSRLYGVQPFYEGQTLEARIKSHVSLEAGLAMATKLTRAVIALHRLNIVHRDIKPDNAMLTGEGLKLIDLGVARLPRVDDFVASEIPGTPSYLAPEMFGGNAGDQATDQFALGVTLWRVFVGKYPYGEIEAFSRPRYGVPELPSKSRPELPAWLDAVLMRSVAIDPEDRYGDVTELLRALEGGAAVARVPLRQAALLERNPVRFWQGVAALLGIALVAALLSR
jgi:serine/threonine protein phosphatase PrpC